MSAPDPFLIDDDNPEWTAKDFAAAAPAAEVMGTAFIEAQRRGGRPRGSNKQQVTLRLDKDVLEHFRAGGAGWQSRINDKLREVVTP